MPQILSALVDENIEGKKEVKHTIMNIYIFIQKMYILHRYVCLEFEATMIEPKRRKKGCSKV